MNDEDVLNKVQQHLNGKLDNQSDLSDKSLESQLTQARIAALDKAERNTFFSLGSLIMPAPAFVVASLLVLTVTLINITTTDLPINESFVDVDVDVDIEMLTNTDNLDLYEDLEFYEWLLHEEQSSS